MQRESISTTFPLGSKLPPFSLPSTDGSVVTDAYFEGAKASLVVFTCNHCPYVKGSEQHLVQIVSRFLERGLKVVAMNSNDATQYPEDSFERMKEKRLPFPYLYDQSQAVAKSFDAACTPELYLFNGDKTLVFHGTINDSPRDSARATKDFLTPAIEQVLAGGAPQPSFVHPIGCSIKWKS